MKSCKWKIIGLIMVSLAIFWVGAAIPEYFGWSISPTSQHQEWFAFHWVITVAIFCGIPLLFIGTIIDECV